MATYYYETKSLQDIYSLLGNNIGDTITLKLIAHKAYLVALHLQEMFTDKYIHQYLDDQLAIDALSPYLLMTCVLHNDGLWSHSHGKWLHELKKAKLEWNWNTKGRKEINDTKVQLLLSSFNDIQTLALSYPSHYGNDI